MSNQNFLARYGDSGHVDHILNTAIQSSVIGNVFKNPTIEDSHLLKIAEKHTHLSQGALTHKNFKSFDSLVHDKNVHGILATNQNCPAHILQKIYDTEPKYGTRLAVLKNQNCPSHILEKESVANTKSMSDNLGILNRISENKNTPSHVLSKLVDHPFLSVRHCTLKNPNTPVQHAIDALDDSKETYSADDAESAILHPHIPDEHIVNWARSNNEAKRYFASKNQNIRRETFDGILHRNGHDIDGVELETLDKFYPNGYKSSENTVTQQIKKNRQ